MSSASLREKARLVALALGTEASGFGHGTLLRLRGWLQFRPATPDRLLISPQDIRTADPTIADDVYAGHLVFGGSFVDAHGQSPFDIVPPTRAWAEALHGFGWLRHLRAANTALARANARAMVNDWITQNEREGSGPAWEPKVVARRLLSWLSQSPMILTPPDAAFYRRFMKSLGRQAAFLQRASAGAIDGEARLHAAIALAEVGLCAEGLPKARKQGSRRLVDELNRQILPDGGHVSRDPAMLVELLLDLLPLRQSFAARSAPVPPALLNAVDRIIPMIRMFRHGDGALALFNGMGATEPDVLATVLTYDDVRARPLLNAPHSGYQRVEAGGTLLICDVGKPPPRPFSQRAHAGTLSFELSAGAHRLIVNCGRPFHHNRQTIAAARSTAAHSTLIVADASSSRMAAPRLARWLGEQIVAGPRHVTVNRRDDGGGVTVEASHDGYADRFKLIHRRRLALSADGHGVSGEDGLGPVAEGVKPDPVAYVLRFHLHPAVRTQRLQSGDAVLLSLPNDDRWLFEAPDSIVSVEESIVFAAAQGARPTHQIVVSGRYPDRTSIAWSIRRIGSPDRQGGTAEPAAYL